MNSRELVYKTIKGEKTAKTPVYGWIAWNLPWGENPRFPEYKKFEDHYEFDMAHIFGGPGCYDNAELERLRQSGVEITPEVLLQLPMLPVDRAEDYKGAAEQIEYYGGDRGRFCYVQSNGIFECLNEPFGIENHLLYLALYPDEIKEVYKRQAEWNARYNLNMLELGADMIHISDDWGSQNSLLFSRSMFEEMILPCHLQMTAPVKKAGGLISLHSDGNINEALSGILEIGYDVLHPWQETAGMSYDVYKSEYADKFAILGGICVQSALGFGDFERLESEIRRVFAELKGRRWLCCTSHFVQPHCSFEELEFAYDLINKLAKE